MGRNECRLWSRSLPSETLDRVVVGHQRRDLRLGDPLKQRLVPGVEVAAQREDLRRVRLAVVLEDPGGESGVQQEHVPRLDDDVVCRHDLFERARGPPPASRGPDGAARSTRTPRPCTPWYAMCSSPRWWAKQRWEPPSPAASGAVRPGRCRPGTRCSTPASSTPSPSASNSAPTWASESHCVEYCSDRVTTSSAHTSTYCGSPKSVHLAHVDVVEGAGVAVHVLGRRQDRRVPTLVEGVPPG